MKMTDTLKEFLESARKIAKRRGNSKVSPYHFLEACASNKFGSTVADMIMQVFDTKNELVGQCYEKTPHGRRSLSNSCDGPALRRAISRAEQISRSFKDSVIGAEHMLLAVLEDKGVQSLPLIKAKGLEMKEQIYRTLDVPTDEQEGDIKQIARIMKDLSPRGRLVKVRIGYLAVYGSDRLCACMFVAGLRSPSVDLEYFLWLIEHTEHLEKKKKGKKVISQKMKTKKKVEVIKPSSCMTAGEANELSLLSRLDPDLRERTRSRLKNRK